MGVRYKMVVETNGYKKVCTCYFKDILQQEVKHWIDKGFDVMTKEMYFERMVAPPFMEAGTFVYIAWEVYVKEKIDA